VASDSLSRFQDTVYSHIDADFAVAVVTPRHNRTARARLHPSQSEAYSSRELRGRHHAPQTSKSFLASKRRDSAEGGFEIYFDAQKGKTSGGRGQARGASALRVPPKTAR